MNAVKNKKQEGQKFEQRGVTRGVSLGGRRAWGEALLPFLENQKYCSDFGKQGPECLHLWAKCSIQIFRVYRRKQIPNVSLQGFFLLRF